jgi:3-hydroxy acid dehydrogenase / malonic semialdehyde reductase
LSDLVKGQTVFITGASAGIGAATARAFAQRGCRILVCARRLDKLQAMDAELRDLGAPDVFTFELDVQNRDDVEGTFATLPDGWREVDILVNNAGLARGLEKFWQDDVQNWEEMIDTNVKGLLYVTKAVVPGMVERNRGHVISLGSLAGHGAYPGGHVYCATKSAEAAIMDGLRLDVNGYDIRVTSIEPGMVETEFSQTRFRGDDARAGKVYAGVAPLTAEDIAETIAWTAGLPRHVQIQSILMTPTAQANSFVIKRTA